MMFQSNVISYCQLFSRFILEIVYAWCVYQISVYTHHESSRELTSHPKYLLCYIFYLSIIVFGSESNCICLQIHFHSKRSVFLAYATLLFVSACVIWDSKNRLSHWFEK